MDIPLGTTTNKVYDSAADNEVKSQLLRGLCRFANDGATNFNYRIRSKCFTKLSQNRFLVVTVWRCYFTMHTKIRTQIHPVLLQLTLILLTRLASAELTEGFSWRQSSKARASDSQESRAANLGFHTDLFTGSMSYQYQFQGCPVRNGVEPSAYLQYNSSSANSVCGVGWELETIYIERDTRSGTPNAWNQIATTFPNGDTAHEPLLKYDDSFGYIVHFGGQSGKLVCTSSPGASPRIWYLDSNPATKFEYYNSASQPYWLARLTDGSVLYLGDSVNSRLDNPHFTANPAMDTFRWMLRRRLDTTGNYTDYTYSLDELPVDAFLYSDQKQLYLSRIDYGGNLNSPVLGHSCALTFQYETRGDAIINNRAGFGVVTRKRLGTVTVGQNGSTIRSYHLTYETSPSTFKSRLKTIQEESALGTFLPPTTFTYQDLPFQFADPVSWGPLVYPTLPFPEVSIPYSDIGTIYGLYNWKAVEARWGVFQYLSLNDIDGDGLPDRLMNSVASPVSKYGITNTLLAQRNTGNGFANMATWGQFDVQGESSKSQNGGIFGIEGIQADIEHEGLDDSPFWFTKRKIAGLYDMDGDGLKDRVAQQVRPFRMRELNIQLNTGSSQTGGFSFGSIWTADPLHSLVAGNAAFIDEWHNESLFAPSAFFDFNGDSLPDRIFCAGPGAPTYVDFNTGFGFAAKRRTLVTQGSPGYEGWWWLSYIDSAYKEAGATVWLGTEASLFDINGDGLPDQVEAWDGGGYVDVLFNYGYGFAHGNDAYNTPDWGNPFYGRFLERRAGIAYSYLNEVETGLNQAKAFILDINGDGLPDRVFQNDIGGQPEARWWLQINNGADFSAPVQLSNISNAGVPRQGSLSIEDEGFAGFYKLATILDINGDGLPDRVMRNPAIGVQTYLVQLQMGDHPDLLKTVDNGIGGKVSVTYRPSTQYDNRDKDWMTDPWAEGAKSLLSFPVQTVHTVTEEDGLGGIRTTTYNYKGGMHDGHRREFCGFAKVEVTDPLGTTARHYFHQGGGRDESLLGEYADAGSFAKRGISFRTEKWGSDGKIYQLALNKVEATEVYPGVFFSYISKSIEFDYADGVNARATAVSQSYDAATGNLLHQTHHGEVQFPNLANYSWPEIESKWSEIGNDEVYTHHTWYGVSPTPPLSNPDIKDKPASVRATADAGGAQILRESLFDYFGGTGLLQRSRDRISLGNYAENSYTYDAYGNLQTHTDEVGVVTQTTYDPETRTFPRQSITGAFTTTTYYDPRSGLLTRSIQASGLVTTNLYDEFFRLKESRVSSLPNIEPDIWTVKHEYRLDGIVNGESRNSVRTLKNNALPGDPGLESWTYTDGSDRIIQTRSEADPQTGMSAPYRVTHLVYDERGAQKFVTLPYFSEGTAFTIASGSRPSTYTEYDAIGRPFRITPAVIVAFVNGQSQSHSPATQETSSPMGPVRFFFSDGADPWVKFITDEDGKTRRYYLDAYARTNRIVETNKVGSSIQYYTTWHKHDLLGQLTNITDYGNVPISWTYDGLGRQVGMTDMHLGVWTYQHDAAGRVLDQTDGRGNRIHFIYTDTSGQQDPLGRLLKKQIYNSANALTETVTYRYDSSDDPANFPVFPGQLASVTDGSGWQKFGYDVRGRTTKQARHLEVNNATYTTQQTYDDADRVQTITYPGGLLVVQNFYDTGGMLNQVQRVGGGYYYTSKGCNELGQGRGAYMGNGTETTLEYFPTSKRLSRLRTSAPGADLLNLTYAYSAANDVKGITDSVATHTGSASASLTATYDDLHRLATVTRPSQGLVRYRYGATGKFVSNDEAGGVYYYLDSARPQATTGTAGTGAYYAAYDSCGNMISRQQYVMDEYENYVLASTRQFDYDPRNRLVNVSDDGTSIATYGYGDSGERLWKQTASSGLQLWIGALYEERDGVARFHVLANGKRISVEEPTTGTTLYNHGDHLGSASVLTSAAGVATRHWEYSAFGQERYPATPQAFAVSHRFTGQVLDEETGLYYYGARYYDPYLARFIQPDTVIPDLGNPQALDRYSYCLNNPLKYVDPSGHGVKEVVDYVVNFSYGLVLESGVGASLPQPATTAGYYGRQGGRITGEAVSATLMVGGTVEFIGGAGIGGLGLVAAPETAGLSLALEGAAVPVMVSGAAKFGVGALMAVNVSKLGPLVNPSDKKTYQTYTKKNPETGEVYSGKTSGTGTPEQNVARREAGHHMNKKGFGPAKLDKSSQNADAIRGREQQLIENNGGAKSQGGTSGNQNNSVGPRNENADNYKKAAEKEFGTP